MAKSKNVKKGNYSIDINPEAYVATNVVVGQKGHKTIRLCGKIGEFTEEQLQKLHIATKGMYTTYLGKEKLEEVQDNYPK